MCQVESGSLSTKNLLSIDWPTQWFVSFAFPWLFLATSSEGATSVGTRNGIFHHPSWNEKCLVKGQVLSLPQFGWAYLNVPPKKRLSKTSQKSIDPIKGANPPKPRLNWACVFYISTTWISTQENTTIATCKKLSHCPYASKPFRHPYSDIPNQKQIRIIKKSFFVHPGRVGMIFCWGKTMFTHPGTFTLLWYEWIWKQVLLSLTSLGVIHTLIPKAPGHWNFSNLAEQRFGRTPLCHIVATFLGWLSMIKLSVFSALILVVNLVHVNKIADEIWLWWSTDVYCVYVLFRLIFVEHDQYQIERLSIFQWHIEFRHQVGIS